MRHVPFTDKIIASEAEIAELLVEALELKAMQGRLVARLESNIATMEMARETMLSMREVQLRMANFIGRIEGDEEFEQAKAGLIASLQEFGE